MFSQSNVPGTNEELASVIIQALGNSSLSPAMKAMAARIRAERDLDDKYEAYYLLP